MSTTKIGLFGIGLDTYWPQFDGLLDRLTGYQQQISTRLRGFGVELVDAGGTVLQTLQRNSTI